MGDFTYQELVEREERWKELGYREGRAYLMDALTEEHRLSVIPEVRDFITKFIRTHGDSNVEIR